MTKKEKLFVAKLLKMAGESYSRHICNDLDNDLLKHFTKDEWKDLALKTAQWNENTLTPEEKDDMVNCDWVLMIYFAHVLETEDK